METARQNRIGNGKITSNSMDSVLESRKGRDAFVGADQRLLKVFVADAHPIIREGIAARINRESDMAVVGEADTICSCLASLACIHADVVTLDLGFQDGSGIYLIQEIASRFPSLRILVVSHHHEFPYISRSLRAGAKGYLCKTEHADRIVPAIRLINEGGIALNHGVSDQFLKRVTQIAHRSCGRIRRSTYDDLFKEMTDRELRVFYLLGSGKSAREIAKQLRISVKTIESHRDHIKRKIGCDDNSELVHCAFESRIEARQVAGRSFSLP